MTDDPRMCPRDGRPCFCVEECDDDALLVRELIDESRLVSQSKKRERETEALSDMLQFALGDREFLKSLVEMYRFHRNRHGKRTTEKTREWVGDRAKKHLTEEYGYDVTVDMSWPISATINGTTVTKACFVVPGCPPEQDWIYIDVGICLASKFEDAYIRKVPATERKPRKYWWSR